MCAGLFLQLQRGPVLWGAVGPGRMCSTTEGVHQGVGARLRLRRSQLQQRLRRTLSWRRDTASRPLPGSGEGGRGRGGLDVRRPRTRRMRHGIVLQVRPPGQVRKYEQAGHVPASPTGLHRQLRSGLRLRWQDLQQSLLRPRSRRLGQKDRPLQLTKKGSDPFSELAEARGHAKPPSKPRVSPIHVFLYGGLTPFFLSRKRGYTRKR